MKRESDQRQVGWTSRRQGNATVSHDFEVGGNLTVEKNLIVHGNVTIKGVLMVNGKVIGTKDDSGVHG